METPGERFWRGFARGLRRVNGFTRSALRGDIWTETSAASETSIPAGGTPKRALPWQGAREQFKHLRPEFGDYELHPRC